MRNIIVIFILLFLFMISISCSGEQDILTPEYEVALPTTHEEFIFEEPTIENEECSFDVVSLPVPNLPTKRITGENYIYGPRCLDDNPEGSEPVDQECDMDYSNLRGWTIICKERAADHCEQEKNENELIEHCVLVPDTTPLLIGSGYTNFYDNLFRRSTFYINAIGERKHNPQKRSFVMTITEWSREFQSGKLWGIYNPASEEYVDKRAWLEECNITNTNFPVVTGKWTETEDEICIQIDGFPGISCENIPDNVFRENDDKWCQLFDEAY